MVMIGILKSCSRSLAGGPEDRAQAACWGRWRGSARADRHHAPDGYLRYAAVASLLLAWSSTLWSQEFASRGIFRGCLLQSCSERSCIMFWVLRGLSEEAFAGAPSADFQRGISHSYISLPPGHCPALKYLPIAIPFGILTVVGASRQGERSRGRPTTTRRVIFS